MALIKIKNLRLRTIIGINDDERINRQDVIINVSIEFDDTQAINSDDIAHTVDYKTISKKIISAVENSSYLLVEKLVAMIADLVMENDHVISTTVEVDKPHAIRFADSVSVTKTVHRSS